ncbi:MAG: family 10 glycosylhydrolase [Phycisphaerae bacterium]|nr:family 10 glycosylhydrolase [Phycisphaerae bacterium]
MKKKPREKGLFTHSAGECSFPLGDEKQIRARMKELSDAGIQLLIINLDRGSDGLNAFSDATRTSSDYPSWDPLGVFMRAAEEDGIRVHFWLAIFKSGCLSDLLAAHPNAEAKFSAAWPSGVRNQGLWSCACQHEVQEYMFNVYADLVDRYRPAGLLMDFIRTGEPCICDSCREAMLEQGVDIREVQKRHDDDHARFVETGAAGVLRRYPDLPKEGMSIPAESVDEELDRWIGWRIERLTTFVRRLRELTRRKNMELSTSVKAFWPRQVPTGAQDWIRWVREGLVDILMPMLYTNDSDSLRGDIERVGRWLISTSAAYYPALGKKSTVSDITPAELGGQLEIVREYRADGVVIFHEAAITHQDLDVLKRLSIT